MVLEKTSQVESFLSEEKRPLNDLETIAPFIPDHGKWLRGTHTNAVAITGAQAASILAFGFKAWELYKLDPRAQYRAAVHRQLTWEFTSRPTPSWIEQYPTLQSVCLPLQMYFSILAICAPCMTELGAKYIRNLKDLALVYPDDWEVLLEYHIAFFDAKNTEMSQRIFDGWAKVDWRLFWMVTKESSLRHWHGSKVRYL